MDVIDSVGIIGLLGGIGVVYSVSVAVDEVVMVLDNVAREEVEVGRKVLLVLVVNDDDVLLPYF